MSKAPAPDAVRLVPVEPTEAMRIAGVSAWSDLDSTPPVSTIYRAMLAAAPAPATARGGFQSDVHNWLLECFGWDIAGDRQERGDRLLEEVLELLQSGGYDPARVAALRDYVWGRPVGEPAQEVGGVMVTLAAYCVAHDLNMMMAGETELARIVQPEIVQKIRAKQAAKPTGSALPIALASQPQATGGAVERGPAGAVMDALWPLLGGDHTSADLWNEIGEEVSRALATQPAPSPGGGDMSAGERAFTAWAGSSKADATPLMWTWDEMPKNQQQRWHGIAAAASLPAAPSIQNGDEG